jgi:hypothetical protein
MGSLVMKSIVLATTALLTLSAVASAECLPEQIAGSWTLVGSNGGAWTICALTIDDCGEFDGRCRGTGRAKRGQPLEGFIELDQACAFTGEWTIRRVTQQLEGALAESGDVAAGIVRFGETKKNLGLHFNLVRTGL